MSSYFIFTVGFLAQILFSARTLAQWIPSEKAGKVLSPLLFWQLSIIAALLMVVYGFLRNDLAIIFGQCITYGIYIRNLYYQKFWQQIPLLFRLFAIGFPLFALTWLLAGNESNISNLLNNKNISSMLMLWGLIGQTVFTFRFIYQWIVTEKFKKSILPLGFWILSICGASMVLSYAIIRKDPVLFIGQLFGFIVYSRNIILWKRQHRAVTG